MLNSTESIYFANRNREKLLCTSLRTNRYLGNRKSIGKFKGIKINRYKGQNFKRLATTTISVSKFSSTFEVEEVRHTMGKDDYNPASLPQTPPNVLSPIRSATWSPISPLGARSPAGSAPNRNLLNSILIDTGIYSPRRNAEVPVGQETWEISTASGEAASSKRPPQRVRGSHWGATGENKNCGTWLVFP